jgi:hypothetical protein
MKWFAIVIAGCTLAVVYTTYAVAIVADANAPANGSNLPAARQATHVAGTCSDLKTSARARDLTFGWAGFAVPTSTVLIAGIVAWTGFQQHRLAREKFKLDMFDRRFAVYKGTQKFLTTILVKGGMELEQLFEFRRDTQDATFLFGPEIPAYLERLDEQAIEMRSLALKFQPLPSGSERNELVEKETKLLTGRVDELPRLKHVFAPYLRFALWHEPRFKKGKVAGSK